MAIVTALLLMMIVVITVSGMVWRQHVSLRRLENASSSLQMNWIARGGFEWARLVLSSDAQSSSTDHLGEIWAQGLPQTPLQENLIDKNSPNSEKLGEISGRISDLQARYNVERLVGSGKVDPLARQTLDKLLQGAGISPGQSATFATRFFLARQNKESVTEQSWTRIEQLSASPELQANWLQLDNHLTWLPQTTPINLNTAGFKVLSAALPDFSENQVRNLISLREQANFRDIADAEQRLNDKSLRLPLDLLSTNSRYFLIEGDVRYGRLAKHYEWTIERNGRSIRLLWQREAS